MKKVSKSYGRLEVASHRTQKLRGLFGRFKDKFCLSPANRLCIKLNTISF